MPRSSSGRGSYGRSSQSRTSCPERRAGCRPSSSTLLWTKPSLSPRTPWNGPSTISGPKITLWRGRWPAKTPSSWSRPEERSEAPLHLHTTPSQVPAVEVTPSGPSYNPSFEDHQTLLWEAHEVKLQWQKKAEKLEQQLALPHIEQVAT